MTTYGGCGRPCCDRSPATRPRSWPRPLRRSRPGPDTERAGRPPLTLVPAEADVQGSADTDTRFPAEGDTHTDTAVETPADADPRARRGPAPLSRLTRLPMPDGVRGALVAPVDGTLTAVWVPRNAPSRVPPGRVLLSWTPAGLDRMDVTAHLGLPGTQVLLACWPGLRGDWSGVVRPTVAEVTELHAALRLATVLLEGLTD
ncbi:hypothetical protein SAMN05216223_12547 [Actinacidiphila yanglinensis]|uniref:Uncharacterized protein n=1 Tax=Actinacidiphila yanglinensis TaxID=310779 RepID=A0A1H6E445_9ACTN|nr:hypothetical protein [Actinacidiphila yanglinensis]SEG92091.1 hypothetical protein SAMN05216223_12547 [Actinacidiphila yanglinensis]